MNAIKHGLLILSIFFLLLAAGTLQGKNSELSRDTEARVTALDGSCTVSYEYEVEGLVYEASLSSSGGGRSCPAETYELGDTFQVSYNPAHPVENEKTGSSLLVALVLSAIALPLAALELFRAGRWGLGRGRLKREENKP